MDDAAGTDKLKALVMTALVEADGQGQTLVACLLAEALDAIGHRPGAVVVTRA
jgi:hypothetical protein